MGRDPARVRASRVEDEARWEAIARTDACRRWWHHMADVMPTNPDESPASEPLREVFHLGPGDGRRG